MWSRCHLRISRSLILAGALATAGAGAFGAQTPEPGQSFPALTEFALEGELPDLADAKVVLIDFWASWCAPCKASFPVYNELQRAYASKGLTIVAVSVDQKRAAMETFLKRFNPTFAVVRDAGQQLVSHVAVPAMPTSFILDANGAVRFVHTGFYGDKSRKEYIEEIESLLAEAS